LASLEQHLSYIAHEMATTYHGMMIAIPEPEWDRLYAMSLTELAAIFQALAQRVNLRALRKSPRCSGLHL
jgi:hypothetical protein